MKVAWILPLLDFGGVESHCLTLAPRLRDKGIELLILNIGPEGRIGVQLEQKGFPVTNLNCSRRISSLTTTLKVWDWLKKSQVDLVHTRALEANWHGGLAAFGLRKPLIVEEVGVSVTRNARIHNLVRFVYQKANRTIAVAQEVAEWLDKYGYLGKRGAEILLNPVDTTLFKTRTRKTLDISKDTAIIGCVGRLLPPKGQDVFLNSIPIILQKYKNIQFKLIGDGISRPVLENQVKQLAISDWVEFLGYRNDIAEILATLDIYVLPSYTESTSISLLEAMASGCPCVATAVGGTPSVLNSPNLGVLVPPGNPQALADAIISLLETPTKAALIGRNASEYVKKYDIDNYINQLVELYLQVVREKPN